MIIAKSILNAYRATLHTLRSSLFNNQGSALVLALVMVTIITSIVGIIMMTTWLQWRFIRDDQNRLQALYLAEAGVYKTIWYLSDHDGKNIFWRPENETIELFDDDVANISVKEWGGYLQITSTASAHHVTKTVRVWVGERPPLPFQQALVVGGVDYPLVVTGKNRIAGDVTVGPEGVKKGRIKGRDFEGQNLVEGKILRQKKPHMPYFSPVLFQNAQKKYISALESPAGPRKTGPITLDSGALEQIQEERIHIDGDVRISIRDTIKTKLICCSGNMSIQGHTQIINDIELAAGGKIMVADHVKMQNCILFAKSGIEVSGDSQITGQLLSNGDIILKEQAALNYPSVVYCNGTFTDQTWRGQISLQDQVVIRGTVILDSGKQTSEERDETMIHITTNAKVVGTIYSKHDTDHQGKVYGSIMTGKFFLYESPTIYLNWLQDAVTDRLLLPEGFLLPIGFSEQPQLEVLTWEELKVTEGKGDGEKG